MKKIFALFLAFTGLMCVRPASAQTLVFHLPDGAVSEVSMPCSFTFSSSGDKLIIDGSGTHLELQRDRILAMTYRPTRGDSNNDMKVDVADIATIISIMSGKEDGNEEPGTEPTTPETGEAPEGAKAIDLGLPSGTKWANMNIGATAPNESGLYFAWGETTGYTADTSDGRIFDFTSYKWMTTDSISRWGINKYQVADNQTSGIWYEYDWDVVDYRFVGDGKTTLDLEDDAARANWGGDWRMPTKEDFDELLANTTSEWITVGEISGYKITSKKNSNSIFFPYIGYRWGGNFNNNDNRYWSSSLSSHSTCTAYLLRISSAEIFMRNDFFRAGGYSIRPVLK